MGYEHSKIRDWWERQNKNYLFCPCNTTIHLTQSEVGFPDSLTERDVSHRDISEFLGRGLSLDRRLKASLTGELEGIKVMTVRRRS